MENTVTPVGEDLIRSVMRRPYRERFAIILNEFGAGLAGRGKDLRTVIRKANPALRELDKVLAILARQNKLLADGSRAGDRVLAEWAKERKAVANAIVQGNIAAQATAERRADLERNFELFPKFIKELTPTMAALDRMTSQMTPVASDLNASGTDISRTLEALAPFSRNGIPALPDAGRHRGHRHAGARGRRADDRAPGRLHRRRGQPLDQPGEAAHEPPRRERHQEPDGPHLQRDALDERL